MSESIEQSAKRAWVEVSTLREQNKKLADENEQFANYAKQKPHLYGGCDEITTLREQVEKLTEAYNQSGRTVQDYGRAIDQTESRLREVATHCANVEQQLLALAEQNAKMRAFVIKVSEQTPEKPDYWSSCGQCEHNSSNAEDLLELPDLATSILNKEEGEIK